LPTLSKSTQQQFSSVDEDVEKEISQNPIAELFAWTLTHSTSAFSEIAPVFKTREELLDHVMTVVSNQQGGLRTISYRPSSEISRIAFDKIGNEWRAWVNVHIEFSLDEHRLDNMLMMVLYRFILERDLKRCVLCQSITNLTIHHIIQKRRNVRKSVPPFGRSVPTNLITLCRSCHSFFDPLMLA